MATTLLFEYIVFFTVAGIATQQWSSLDEVYSIKSIELFYTITKNVNSSIKTLNSRIF